LRFPENFLLYLSAHRECSERLIFLAEGVAAEELELSVDPTSLRLKRMVRDVMAEVHRMKGFVRLKPLGSRILYGYLNPRHRIGWLISDHFALRNSGMVVVIGNGFQSWISLSFRGAIVHHHGQGLSETLEKLETAVGGLRDEGDIDGVWRICYESQYCPNRRNLDAFHRRMPKRDLNSCGSAIELNRNGTTLDNFFPSEDDGEKEPSPLMNSKEVAHKDDP